MKIDIKELEAPRNNIIQQYYQLPSNLLSSIADNMKNDEYLEISLNGKALSAIGSDLCKGILCVYGNLSRWTGNGMRGGYFYIKGDVERLSNVFHGIIYVDGNIEGLINIHKSVKLLCSGTIGYHVFGVRNSEPSPNIYCINAPSNYRSIEISEINKLSRKYQYLVKLNELDNIPRITVGPYIKENLIKAVDKVISEYNELL